MPEKAVSYLRVSSRGQIEKSGFDRQRSKIAEYAASQKFSIVDEFREEGVSGTAGIKDRPALVRLIDRVEKNGVRVVLVEKADRLARDLIESEIIIRTLRDAGVRVISADGGVDLTEGDSTNPTAQLVRQLLGAVAQFEKDLIAARLAVGRAKKIEATGRCGGPLPYGSTPEEAEILRLAKALRRKPRKGTRRSLAEVAEELNTRGLLTRRGRPWTPGTVHNVLK